MAVFVRGRSSVMPCLDQYGRLSTLCLLLSWQLPAHRGAVGSVVLDIQSSILSSILRKGMVPSVLLTVQHRKEYTMFRRYDACIVASKVAVVVCCPLQPNSDPIRMVQSWQPRSFIPPCWKASSLHARYSNSEHLYPIAIADFTVSDHQGTCYQSLTGDSGESFHGT
ncbi:hypothetical protein EI94DRAFT_636192 [Lactarius quietus]|nr:hypothetical protein EI94DRAFT_636192 [Lactarius quietus]